MKRPPRKGLIAATVVAAVSRSQKGAFAPFHYALFFCLWQQIFISKNLSQCRYFTL